LSNGSVFPGKFINVSLKHWSQAHNPLLLYVYCMFIMLKFTTITIKLHYLPLLLIQYAVLFLPSLLIKFLPFFVEFLFKSCIFLPSKLVKSLAPYKITIWIFPPFGWCSAPVWKLRILRFALIECAGKFKFLFCMEPKPTKFQVFSISLKNKFPILKKKLINF